MIRFSSPVNVNLFKVFKILFCQYCIINSVALKYLLKWSKCLNVIKIETRVADTEDQDIVQTDDTETTGETTVLTARETDTESGVPGRVGETTTGRGAGAGRGRSTGSTTRTGTDTERESATETGESDQIWDIVISWTLLRERRDERERGEPRSSESRVKEEPRGDKDRR